MAMPAPSHPKQQVFKKIGWFLSILGVVLLILFLPVPQQTPPPTDKYFEINASKFQFVPGEISVNPGDRVTIKLISDDVVHGLSIDNTQFELKAEPGQPASATFVAGQAGVFRFRCTVTCGNLHPFMLGKLRVGSNLLFIRGIALAIAASIIGLFSFSHERKQPREKL